MSKRQYKTVYRIKLRHSREQYTNRMRDSWARIETAYYFKNDDSGDFDTFDEAVAAAKAKYPNLWVMPHEPRTDVKIAEVKVPVKAQPAKPFTVIAVEVMLGSGRRVRIDNDRTVMLVTDGRRTDVVKGAGLTPVEHMQAVRAYNTLFGANIEVLGAPS